MAAFAVTVLLFLPIFSAAAISDQYVNFTSFSIQDSPWRVDQNRVLVSPGGSFAAGFRPLPTSPHLFLFAVWYRQSNETIVWAMNRDSPVSNSSSLVFSKDGKLILSPTTISVNATASSNSTKLVLEETGGLQFDSWTSFDDPMDTILPGQTLPSINLVARRSLADYRSGFYNLVNWTSLSFYDEKYGNIDKGPLTNLTSDGLLKAKTGDYYLADFGENDTLRRLTLDPDGNLRVYSMNPANGRWFIVWRLIPNLCRVPGLCGLNSICMSDVDDQVSCVCPPGFRRTAGSRCEPIINITAPAETRFLQLDFVNFTKGLNPNVTSAPTLSNCETGCLDQPSCRGFVYQFDGSGYCAHLEQLLEGRWSPGTLTAAYIRVSKRENAITNFTGLTELVNTTCPVRLLLPEAPDMSNPRNRNLAIVCCFFALELLGAMAFFWTFIRRHTHYRESAGNLGLDQLPLRRFTLAELTAATDDFSHEIGSGGFGTVYKGELPDHRVVAVKRLKFSSRCSSDAEFWAEAAIIARLHHLNLVRLWGFCAEKGQRLLVYEYVPNGSLNKFLFPAAVREQGVAEAPMLDWSTRYRIAIGVARAIAYLHEECREWVLHCDIKPENILLENDFCPKVSDFGLAKLATKADMVSMSGIRGTRGYLAPEWAGINPTITAKADVYSFGMVLLEIVCGIRNMEFQQSSMESCEWYLPKWAYEKACVEKKVEDILDPRLLQSYDCRQHSKIVDRMVKTAIWCLQDRPEMRPSMGKVAKMLEGTVDIVEPPQATIFFLGPSPSLSPLPGQKNSAPKTADA
ncbi:G-type lectin S-receptor-like serine/threonine-protein kinase At5g24080 [Nymphaea colorata]|nr:G-type lectin S-receptor-like serine/threonine-protein kinase At5g24080 [Nymphaea colorata]